MKSVLIFSLIAFGIIGCKERKKSFSHRDVSKDLAVFFERYYEERLQLFPLQATAIGDNRYNDLLPISFTDSYRSKLDDFYERYLTELNKFEKDKLSERDRLNYDVFEYDTKMKKKALAFMDSYTPFNQFYAVPLSMGQLGSGAGDQPFKTIKDYDDWQRRASAFKPWADSAIFYFGKGFIAQYVLPKAIVLKMIPQMKAMIAADVTKSVFYGPILKIPPVFSDADKRRITQEYTKLIKETLEPSYKKLADFLEQTYLPKARTTSGIGSLPGGGDYYAFLVEDQTTTNKTPAEIYKTGIEEVARIRKLMDSVKNATAFTGDLYSFFEYMQTDKKFTPFKTPKDILDAFKKIHQTMQSHVAKMFKREPRTAFEIRQTEAFRAASASPEYAEGSADGSRPGIFYVPIIDATTFNTGGMESLFLHEAIPGHHYQLSLQQEDTTLPKFRRYDGNNAYVEGWALYCESLGKDLGLYTDPYQFMGALGDEMHRAIRLVVDVAIHTKGMRREEAIRYMMNNEAISEQEATAEIERYMAIPGQALSYKIGALKIKELRDRYEKQLGSKFNLADFHDEILKNGPLPLGILETQMNAWVARQ
jgi:uncharacterized protein (DUF885 family)